MIDITFDEYDNIVEKGKDYPYDTIQIEKMKNFERLVNDADGITFLICLLEYGEFNTVERKEIKKNLNELLKTHLNFVESK